MLRTPAPTRAWKLRGLHGCQRISLRTPRDRTNQITGRVAKGPPEPAREMRLVGKPTFDGDRSQGLSGHHQLLCAQQPDSAQVFLGRHAQPLSEHPVHALPADSAVPGQPGHRVFPAKDRRPHPLDEPTYRLGGDGVRNAVIQRQRFGKLRHRAGQPGLHIARRDQPRGGSGQVRGGYGPAALRPDKVPLRQVGRGNIQHDKVHATCVSGVGQCPNMNDTWAYRNQVAGTGDKRASCDAAAALPFHHRAERPLFVPMRHPLLSRLQIVHLLQIGQRETSHVRSAQRHSGKLPVMRFTQRFPPTKPIPSIASSV